jgi:DNA-binding transcriptional ArsR family regulator
MSGPSFRLGWPLYAGMLVAGAAAVVASASTLSSLAEAAGWSSWTPWLLPAALDIGGSAGGWCWLRPDVPEPARRFGRFVALAGANGSLIGNAAGHLMSTGYLHPGPVLVVIVGAVPAAVLVALAHLAALLAAQPIPHDAAPEPTPAEQPAQEEDDVEAQDDAEPEHTADTRTGVLQLLQEQPRTIAELATATGRSRTTVTGHLAALTKAGHIHRDSTKRYAAITRPHLIPDPAAAAAAAGAGTAGR